MNRSILVALAFSVLISPLPSHAQEGTAEFYKNRQVVLKIGSATGGGYDTLGRAVARAWGKHIPGNPSFIVQNVPGASSLTLTNQVYSIEPRDGSVIALANNVMPTAPILYPETGRFDPGRFSWIGGPSRDHLVVMVWHTAPVQTLDELFEKELIVGAGSAVGPADYPRVFNEVLGTKFRLIIGYQGTEQIDLAIERGELHGNAGLGWVSAKTRNAAWLDEKKAKVIAQYGYRPHRDLPDVPLFPLPENEADRQIIDVLYARQETGRPFFGPPDVPAARLTVLRRSFDAMLKDPEFLADAERLNLIIDPVTGEELEEIAKRLAATSPDVAERIRKLLN